MRGTSKRIFIEEPEETEIISAALLAHSNAISVLPVPLLYIMEPRKPLEIVDEILSRQIPVFKDVPVQVPGMPQSEILANVQISETNVVNPHLLLENYDIIFVGNTLESFLPPWSVTFSEKGLFRYPESVFIPYGHVDRNGGVLFPFKIGNTIIENVALDTGSSGASGFVVNNDVAYELGIARYQKISTRPDTYLVPVSIPNTPVRFIIPMTI
jgi:hypothetical protein